MAATAAEMVELLKTALETNAGVVSVNVNGQSVTYGRDQALRELTFWEERAGQEAGTRPIWAGINLSGF
jgi:hypothetical protein